MATGYESLLDQGQPSYGSMLNQPPSYASVLGQRTQMLDQTASGQALNPDEVAKTDAESATVLSELSKGLRRSGFSVLATSQAAAGAAIEPFAPDTGQGLIQQGLRTIQGMPSDLQAAVPKWADVHDFGSGARYVAGTAGETLPMAALALGTGLLGRGAGLGVGALRGLRGTALETAANRASWGGGIAAMAPMMGGQEAMDISQDPVAMANTTPWQRAGMTAVSGIGGAVLQEAVPQALVLPHILGKAARIEPGIAAGLRNTALLAGEGAAGMYGANAAQSLLDQAVHNYANPAAGYDFGAAHEAGMAGLLPGALLGGLGGAGQAVHSNIAAGVDLAKQGVSKVTSKMPTFDDIVGGVLKAVDDPEGTGRALAGATLEGIAKAGEAAGVLRQYGAKGLETGEQVVSKLYDGTVNFINKNLTDPQIKDDFLQRAAELKTMGLPAWNIFKRDLAEKTGKEFTEDTAIAGTLLGSSIWKGTKQSASWISDVAKGAYSRFTEGEGKASTAAPDTADRQAVMQRLYDAAPGIKDAVEKMAPSLNSKRALGDVLHYAMNDAQFFPSAQGEPGETVTKTSGTAAPTADPTRVNFLNEWQRRTGTDLNKVLDVMRSGRNDALHEEITSSAASSVMKRLGINPEHHDDLLNLVQNSGSATYADLPAPLKAELFRISGKNELKAVELYNGLATTVNKRQLSAEQRRGAGDIGSQMSHLGDEPGGATGAAPTSDEGGYSGGTTNRSYDENGNPMDEATETRSPFDQDVFKRILTSRGFHHSTNTSMPVTLHVTNADVSPVALGNLFGERVSEKGKPDRWEPAARHQLTPDKTGLQTKISPMSLASVVGEERFRNQFAPHVAAFSQREGKSKLNVKGERFMNALSTLSDHGLHIDPERLGLPKDHPLVHVKVGIDMKGLHDGLIVHQESGGRNMLTWGDMRKAAGLEVTPRKQLERLGKLTQQSGGSYEGIAKLLRNSNEPVDQQISKVAFARAMARLNARREVLGRKENLTPAEQLEHRTTYPSNDAQDHAVREYHAAIPELQKQARKRTKMYDYAANLREAYRSGDLTSEQFDHIIEHYAGAHDSDFLSQVYKPSKELLDVRGFDRRRTDTLPLAERMYADKAEVDRGKQGIEATEGGRGEEGSVRGTIENDWADFKITAAQKNERERMATAEKSRNKQLGDLSPKDQKDYLKALRAERRAEGERTSKALELSNDKQNVAKQRAYAKAEAKHEDAKVKAMDLARKRVETNMAAEPAKSTRKEWTGTELLKTEGWTKEEIALAQEHEGWANQWAQITKEAKARAEARAKAEKYTPAERALAVARAERNVRDDFDTRQIHPELTHPEGKQEKAPLPVPTQYAKEGRITPETKVTTYPEGVSGIKKEAPAEEAPAPAQKDRSAEVKTFTERVSSMLEMRRKSLLLRAGDNPTLIDRINQHINAALKGVVDAAGELHQKLQNSSVGDLLNHYRPLLLKHLQPLEDAVTKARSVVQPKVDEAREGGKGTTAARYDEISKSESQDKVTFLNKRLKNPLTHSDLDGLMQGWVKKYLPTAAVKLHIYDKQAGDPRGFVFHQTGDTTIYLANQHVDRVSAIATMAHEFGHLLQYNHFNDAPVEVKNPIMAAYNADVKALMGGKLTTEEAIQRFGNAGTAIMQQKALAGESELQTRVMKAGGKVGDEAAFKEWFANQFSKMVTSGLDRPVSPAERSFWKSLSDKTKDFFNTVVKKLTPSTSYESWVKELARSQGDVTSKVIDDATPPPGKPPSPPPPPGPGEVPPGGGFPHDEAKKRFTDVVHSMMGDKKVQILFDQKLAAGVKGTFSTRREKLDQLGKQRVALVNELKDAQQRGAQKSIDHLTDQLEAVKAQENSLLADTAIQGTIQLATGMEKKNGLAEHETFHAAFKMFFDDNERRVLGQAFTQGLAGARLREIFKDDPTVLARIDPLTGSPEEAAAYAFQIWAQDPSQFQLGPKTKTIFQKMLNFVRKLVGSLTLDERAQMIMESLKSGRRYEQNISPVQKILDKDTAWKERAQKMAQDVGGLLKQGYDILLTPARDRLIDTENPALTKIARLAYQQTGEAGNEGGMTQRGRKQFKLQQNELGRIFDKLTEPQLQALHQHMVMGTTLTDPAVAERAKQLHSWYRDMYQYQNRAGVQLNNAGIKEDYYPLTWSPEKVLKNKQAFIDMLEQPKYAEKMLILKKTPNELYNSITSYIDRGEDLVNVMGQNNEPLSESSKARTLGFLDKADRIPFMDDDPIHTSFRYMKQAIRQAEYVRSFGENGVKLKAMKDEAKDVYGATPDQLALVNDYIDGTLGNKEVGMSRELKDLYGALNVYENYRLLPFNLFSSLIDPMGIAIRSNSAMDAWHTFSYSIKGLFNEWKKDYPRDFFAKYAEDMGIIEHSGTTISAHNQFDGITLRGTTKSLNDKLFKYNLLNGWVRNNTIMATKAGQRFIYRSAEGAFGKHSQRYLDELGLTKDDVHYDKTQNRLLLYADELEAAGMNKADAAALETKLGNAVEKFVRQSLLNPNSAELPNWMSNPYMAPIAHLKQFVFSFEATILARIKHEMKNDNFKPAALAAAYVPGMIAADFLKDMIAGTGSQPPYKQGWGFYDYFNDGVQRSGLLGSGQFFTSMQEDIARGGGGYETAAGPAAQQLQQGAKAFTSGNSTAIKDWMIKSMPLMPVYKQHFISGQGAGGKGSGGGGSSALGLVDDVVMAAAKSS